MKKQMILLGTRNGTFLAILAALVWLSRLVSAAPLARSPQVGIDTTFGDRVHEAASALRLKHYQEAIAKVSAALAMQPDDKNASILFAMRGNAFWKLDDERRALADYNEAIRRDPTIKDIHGRRGILNYNRGNYAAAVADLTVGLRETRDPGYLYHSRALAFLKEGKREQARSDFERVTQAPALQALGYVNRGNSFLRLGDVGHAALDFATAKRMASSDQAALNSIAWFEATSPRAEFRNGRAAVRDAKRACERSKWKNPDFIDTLAAAYAEMGDFVQAESYEKQAIALEADPGDGKGLQEHLALFAKGQPVRDDFAIR